MAYFLQEKQVSLFFTYSLACRKIELAIPSVMEHKKEMYMKKGGGLHVQIEETVKHM